MIRLEILANINICTVYLYMCIFIQFILFSVDSVVLSCACYLEFGWHSRLVVSECFRGSCSTVPQSCNKYTRDRVVGVDPPGLSVCYVALQCERAPRNRFPTCTLHIALLWVGAPSDTRSPLLAHQPPWVLNIPQ